MRRMLVLLIMLIFVGGQSVAAFATCQHSDQLSHAAALESADGPTATAAHAEELAAAAADQSSSLADAAAGALGALIPPDPIIPPCNSATMLRTAPGDVEALESRAIPPLLTPPLA